MIAVIILGFIITILVIRRNATTREPSGSSLIDWVKSLQNSIDTQNRHINDLIRGTNSDVSRVISENTRQLGDRIDNASKLMADLQKHVGEMSEIGRGIKSLQDFLSSPKLRGGLGEEVLSDMIGQTFPKNSFHLQYSFKSGSKVDAVLKTDAGLLCIDSKFPSLDIEGIVSATKEAKNIFVSSVKKHMLDISKKYILADEGTLDFALMYIPSEAVYYEVVNSRELINIARDLRVYPVSPNTLYAHLQVLLQSLQGKELEAQSVRVIQILRSVQKDYTALNQSLMTLNRHITNSHNQVFSVMENLNSIGRKLTSESLTDGTRKVD